MCATTGDTGTTRHYFILGFLAFENLLWCSIVFCRKSVSSPLLVVDRSFIVPVIVLLFIIIITTTASTTFFLFHFDSTNRSGIGRKGSKRAPKGTEIFRVIYIARKIL